MLGLLYGLIDGSAHGWGAASRPGRKRLYVDDPK
jgi:hypothetical protein